ncbi:DNA/RNA non-specific endonuclease [Photobacterium sanguinicancri]|uniref:Endonuclease n=1 Tax=Photobacterium sanguinicancri TaxID=875932 RepID=A0AAW7Y6M3_9GAMM|nr:DNA/RNA non-specific endonuclease [Photobacterium sanguinicancri]MDO6543946.1 DNA/RNA non-specific endonuclease [Photobacterium sanguinicancri]
MKHLLFAIFSLSLSISASAAVCNQHLVKGTPNNSDQVLCRDGYAAGYNYQNKVSNWVAYHITKESVNAFYKRSNSFRTDKELPIAFRATSSDYSKSGYDRGHLAPSGTMDFSQVSMQQSFLMTNMAPQLPGFNRGGWKGLEEKVREWANTYNELYVVSGPIWDGNETYIGNGVYIPHRFYKVILDPTDNDAIAFILPHRKISSSELPSFITTVDEVEQVTQLDFFSALPDSIENDIEAQTWNMW